MKASTCAIALVLSTVLAGMVRASTISIRLPGRDPQAISPMCTRGLRPTADT